MASAGLDTMITVKVNFEGATRRTKMPLRDMIPGVLESNIRTFLHIPTEAETVFERYSDSASSFVQLTPGNIPVYKQLYRAAKAKSKLKIRVSVKEPAEKTVPKPVSVEDELEASSSSPAPETPVAEMPQEMSQEIKKEISPVPTPAAAAPAPPHASLFSDLHCTSSRAPLQTVPAYLGDAARFVAERQEMIRNRAAQKALAPRPAPPTQFRAPYRPKHTSNDWNHWTHPTPAGRAPTVCPAMSHGTNFAVCCNSCEKTIPDVHYHCSTCDDGDFDLCQFCVDQGISCHSSDHWLIKRTCMNGQLIQSTTERIAPKPKKEEKKEEPEHEHKVEDPKPELLSKVEIEVKNEPAAEIPSLPIPTFEPLLTRWAAMGHMRTCNCCVQELPEQEFVHCITCEDYDLCQPCFAKGGHGHHPKHAFVPAVRGTVMPEHIKVKMAPGRNQLHHAICDGCDKYITGVRHKCLDCPDWDYCSSCIQNASFVHPNHRFVPVYEHLATSRPRSPQPVHVGICCDGIFCGEAGAYPAYIRGTRYKCAVCHDLDFCANCEASPSNTHNKTHPLIKFKTPVRHVSVTTTGEHHNGQRMPAMGDRKNNKSTETVSSASENSINPVQTVIDQKPVELAEPDVKDETLEPEIKEEEEKKTEEPIPKPVEKLSNEPDLQAIFVRDTIEDGIIMPPNYAFQQTWTLRNEGKDAWPAGCSIKFVGGDYMGHVDSNHPAGISELVSASESTTCYNALAPGQEFSFSVLLRTPSRPGKIISYWRLTSPDGHKFGHRLWCDINVRLVKESLIRASPSRTVESDEEEPKNEENSVASSQMIFPRLDKESPIASIHVSKDTTPEEPETKSEEEYEDAEDVEDNEWDASEDGFMTDEEYDILDASDEEWLEDQNKKLFK